MDTFDNSAQITLRDTEFEVTAWGIVSCTVVQLLYQPISVNLSLSIGDIGGQMGLFIGASVLTILEIFDYLYEVK